MEDVTQQNQEKPEQPVEESVVSLSASEHKKLMDELAQAKDKYVRLYAEFDNARKRMEREKQEFVKYANEGLVLDFLNILDDLERSFQAARAQHQDYTAFLKGIEMVMAHVYDLLKRHGVKPIEAKGKLFDPHCHEVLLQEESDSLEENTVIEEFQKGYMLEDRVVRTAKVKISKKKEQ
jgi:molecular chaperone GrpE